MLLTGLIKSKIQAMKRPLVTILSPCLNENATIYRLIKDAKKNGRRCFREKYEIVIADNGSTDGSLDIIKREKGVRLVEVPVRGYGAALHWGIMNARGKYIIFADSDLSYPLFNISKFKQKMNENPDLVLGSRLKGRIAKGAMPFLHRYFGTPILTFLIRIIYRIPTTDCNSGMRMVKKDFYKRLNMRNSGMEWASELLIKTAIKKGKYLEVPVVFRKDQRNKQPNLSTWADGWRHLKSIFLLKPQSLLVFLALLMFAAVYFYDKSFALAFLFVDLTVVLFLGLLTVALLESIIDKKPNIISNFLSKFLLVPFILALSLFIGMLILIIPDSHLGTKLFLVSILGIVFMWVFLIETIKTHLINRLPDDK
jgi:glycosyltransferase involved in cell wall biosynthesis